MLAAFYPLSTASLPMWEREKVQFTQENCLVTGVDPENGLLASDVKNCALRGSSLSGDEAMGFYFGDNSMKIIVDLVDFYASLVVVESSPNKKRVVLRDVEKNVTYHMTNINFISAAIDGFVSEGRISGMFKLSRQGSIQTLKMAG